MRGGSAAVFVVGVLVPFVAGCRPTDVCAETGSACGGDPVGSWAETDVCQDPTIQDKIAAKQTYFNQPLVPGGQSPPQVTSTDWCSSLQYIGTSGISFFALPRDTPAIQGAFLSYSAGSDGSHTQGLYTTLITSSDKTSINYSASCLQRFGYAPGSCADFAAAFAAYGSSLGGIKETSCQDSGDGGCLCSYLSESDAAGTDLSGIWSSDGHVITHFAGSGVLPTQVDYCVQGNQMTLWGHDRTSILNSPAGLRTLVLRKVVCGDGIVDRGEECDPPDQTTCSSTCQTIAAQ